MLSQNERNPLLGGRATEFLRGSSFFTRRSLFARLGKSCQNAQAHFDDFPLKASARDLITAPANTVLFVNKENQKNFRAHPYGMLWQGIPAYIKLRQPHQPIVHSPPPKEDDVSTPEIARNKS
ncbi:hypothetical protein [uncultured Rikenella sp.]|uniref:hypothetical protein n=1 Tax=uncultured Rikenella sp. TaxID=368003 RepID=UPI00272B8A37|nr:hypothetical protein [uncultured Rikenella sp.]